MFIVFALLFKFCGKIINGLFAIPITPFKNDIKPSVSILYHITFITFNSSNNSCFA